MSYHFYLNMFKITITSLTTKYNIVSNKLPSAVNSLFKCNCSAKASVVSYLFVSSMIFVNYWLLLLKMTIFGWYNPFKCSKFAILKVKVRPTKKPNSYRISSLWNAEKMCKQPASSRPSRWLPNYKITSKTL